MIDFGLLLVALFLPWIVAFVWLKKSFGSENPEYFVLIGYSYPLGMIGVTMLLRSLDYLGFQLSFEAITLVLLCLLAIPILIFRRSQQPSFRHGSGLNRIQKLLCGSLLILIGLRLAVVSLEVFYRPVYPWDTWLVWAPRARIWFELKEIVPVVSPAQWWQSTATDAYTVIGHTQPDTVSLIQTWVTLGLGRWDDSLMNLPWVLCLVSMLFAVYGQARAIGAGAATALLLCYMLASMPILDVHVGLAGYADLWMGACFVMAVMTMIRYFSGDGRKHFWLFLIFAPLPVLLKKSGPVLVSTLIPGLFHRALIDRTRLMLLLTAISIASVVFIFMSGVSFTLPGIGPFEASELGLAIPGFPPVVFKDAPAPIGELIEHYFVLGGWHIFWFVMPVCFCVGVQNAILGDKLSANLILFVMSVSAIFSFVFFFTHFVNYDRFEAALNRATLMFAPSFAFCALVWVQRRIDRINLVV